MQALALATGQAAIRPRGVRGFASSAEGSRRNRPGRRSRSVYRRIF
jgi:hypothetical protein